MSEDNIDPTKIPYGTLNDVSTPIGGGRERLTADTSFMDAVVNASKRQFIQDALLGTGPYKAIVLRVETDDKTSEAGSWLSNTFSSFFGAAPKIVKIKARIPEIHAALPVPDQVGDAEGPHQPIIDLYPTFIAQDTQVEAPKAGDIVNVDFGNKNTYSDPIYLGPLVKTAQGAGGAGGAFGGADAFGNCGASNPIQGTPASQPTENTVGAVPVPSSLIYAYPPEYVSGLPSPFTYTPNVTKVNTEISMLLYEKFKDKNPSTWDLGTVYIFGDSQTNGMSDAITEYFSSFDTKYNNWYGGAYRMAYKDVPKDKVKGKNQGKSIESYFQGDIGVDAEFEKGDTIIIGSIGGNTSFNARKKYPLTGKKITDDPYLVALPPKLPTIQGDTPTSILDVQAAALAEAAAAEEESTYDSIVDSAAGAIGSLFGDDPEDGPTMLPIEDLPQAEITTAAMYGLGKLIQDGDSATSFKKFCDILNGIRAKGVNVIIFGLPYGGNEARQEDRVHFDYVQFASFAAEGLGRNYVSVMEVSKLLQQAPGDVHYFKGNGGGGYEAYFNELLKPTLESFYFQYRDAIQDSIEYGKANTPEAVQETVIEGIEGGTISLPGEEKPDDGILDSIGSAIGGLFGGDEATADGATGQEQPTSILDVQAAALAEEAAAGQEQTDDGGILDLLPFGPPTSPTPPSACIGTVGGTTGGVGESGLGIPSATGNISMGIP